MVLGLGVEKEITALSSLITQLRQASFHNLRNFRQLAWWMIYSGHMVRQIHVKLLWSDMVLKYGVQAVVVQQ